MRGASLDTHVHVEAVGVVGPLKASLNVVVPRRIGVTRLVGVH